jgi:uncharacterized protein (DUF1330 family)
MAKGYWLALISVHDPDSYKHYMAALQDVLRKANARYVARAGQAEVMEGNARTRVVVIEFPSYQAALDCYRSPECAKVRALRAPPVADVDLLVVEGYDGQQP